MKRKVRQALTKQGHCMPVGRYSGTLSMGRNTILLERKKQREGRIKQISLGRRDFISEIMGLEPVR